jgi:hypothetical protein
MGCERRARSDAGPSIRFYWKVSKYDATLHPAFRLQVAGVVASQSGYSHSMVPGGFDEMS